MIKKLVFLLIVVGSLGVSYWTIKNSKTSESLISPLGKSFSVLSMFSGKKEEPSYIVYGYLPYWNLSEIKYLQLDKLTDIAYFGLHLEKDGTFKKSLEDGSSNPGYDSWRNNKDLKKLISASKRSGVRFSLTVISHEDEASDAFLDCQSCWDTLITELSKELEYRKIKDVNLNFEYVEYTDGDKADKYSKFVEYINRKLDEKFEDSYVVVSTFADSLVKSRITKVNDLSKASDALFIMGYDFHRSESKNASPVSPIGGSGIHAEYDINTMLKDYLANSPPNKLILGVPYYGYNWVEGEKEEDEKDGEASQSQTHADIMENILEIKPKILWDEAGQVPHFTYVSPETGSTRQVYFENADSLRIKYRLTKDLNLAGVGIWALGYDKGYQELWDLLGEEFR